MSLGEDQRDHVELAVGPTWHGRPSDVTISHVGVACDWRCARHTARCACVLTGPAHRHPAVSSHGARAQLRSPCMQPCPRVLTTHRAAVTRVRVANCRDFSCIPLY